MWILKLVLGGLGWIKDIVAGLIGWAIKNPFPAATIVLAAVCIWGYHSYSVKLDAANHTITTQKTYIADQKVILDQYVVGYKSVTKQLKDTVDQNNKAVADLKKAADDQAAKAKAAGEKAKESESKYQDLATKYLIVNPSTGTAEERIQREEETNDNFFRDFKRIK